MVYTYLILQCMNVTSFSDFVVCALTAVTEGNKVCMCLLDYVCVSVSLSIITMCCPELVTSSSHHKK